MITSGRAALASGGVISGSGFAIANTIGFGAIFLSSSAGSAFAADSPMNTSAPSSASASVRLSVATAWADFHWFMPASRPW